MNRTFAIVAALLVLAGCSDDPMGSSGDRLTRSEAMAVVGNVESSGMSASKPRANVAEDQVDSPLTVNQDVTIPCPSSGRIAATLALSLDLDVDARSLALDAEGSLAHDNCGFPHDGLTLTVTGDPDIEFATHAAISAGQLTVSANSAARGAFNWSASDGRSGRCTLDIKTMTNFLAKTRTTEGHICDFEIDEMVSLR